MEISLVRHGKSQLTDNERMTCMEFRRWVEKYNSNGVFEASNYPAETLEKVNAVKVVISSDLKRSVESAKLLKPEVKTMVDKLYRETELPICSMKLFNIKLSPTIWAIVLRLLWFCGYSNGCESLKEAKIRAEKAAEQLITYALEHESVVLVGHGIFNSLVANSYRKRAGMVER